MEEVAQSHLVMDMFLWVLRTGVETFCRSYRYLLCHLLHHPCARCHSHDLKVHHLKRSQPQPVPQQRLLRPRLLSPLLSPHSEQRQALPENADAVEIRHWSALGAALELVVVCSRCGWWVSLDPTLHSRHWNRESLSTPAWVFHL